VATQATLWWLFTGQDYVALTVIDYARSLDRYVVMSTLQTFEQEASRAYFACSSTCPATSNSCSAVNSRLVDRAAATVEEAQALLVRQIQLRACCRPNRQPCFLGKPQITVINGANAS